MGSPDYAAQWQRLVLTRNQLHHARRVMWNANTDQGAAARELAIAEHNYREAAAAVAVTAQLLGIQPIGGRTPVPAA